VSACTDMTTLHKPEYKVLDVVLMYCIYQHLPIRFFSIANEITEGHTKYSKNSWCKIYGYCVNIL
jgi:hypothetical protein